ncbi:MAG: PHP domain-containing protein [Anaerolineales bacterium]|nr:PHP domain-containing protein [Anaerolineales bacterium]
MTTYTVELHCHTYHSSDSLMLPEQILKICDRRGIERIAITDHNTIAGALETAALVPERVIIGEEILTTEGEILGYFIEEEVPEGLPPVEVVRRLKDQGAVISISHPFDLTRGCRWSMETLEALLPDLDMIEVLNARTWTNRPNLQATVLAERAGLPGAAGSDAHAPVEVGRATVVMPAFSDAETFRNALQGARIRGRRSIPLVHLTSRYAAWRKARGWKRP